MLRGEFERVVSQHQVVDVQGVEAVVEAAGAKEVDGGGRLQTGILDGLSEQLEGEQVAPRTEVQRALDGGGETGEQGGARRGVQPEARLTLHRASSHGGPLPRQTRLEVGSRPPRRDELGAAVHVRRPPGLPRRVTYTQPRPVLYPRQRRVRRSERALEAGGVTAAGGVQAHSGPLPAQGVHRPPGDVHPRQALPRLPQLGPRPRPRHHTHQHLSDQQEDRDEGHAQHLRHLDLLALARDRVGVTESGPDVEHGAVDGVGGVTAVTTRQHAPHRLAEQTHDINV